MISGIKNWIYYYLLTTKTLLILLSIVFVAERGNRTSSDLDLPKE